MEQKIDFKNCYAAIWRSKKAFLKPVKYLEDVQFESLIGIESQKTELIKNTKRFLQKLPSNNVLLWGARGTGKSSLIKALLSKYKDQSLRVIEIDRDDMDDLIEIADMIRDLPYRFIVFCMIFLLKRVKKGIKV